MPMADCRSRPPAPATITASPHRRDQPVVVVTAVTFELSRRVANNPARRLAEDMDRVAGPKLASGKRRVSVQREIENRERADRVKGPDCEPFHRPAAPPARTN